MKVLVAHNAYQRRGGEDAVVEQEVSLLRSAGHQVILAQVNNHEIVSRTTKAKVFLNAPFDHARYEWMQDLISQHRPDVVHVHNFFPLLTPAIHMAAAHTGVAVVQTLHNFRTVCAGAMLMRDGTICEKCLSGSRHWGVVHRCYRGSMLGSLAVARMQWRADRGRVWSRYVHCFIALTQFAKDKFVAGGLPQDRIIIKPNFVAAPDPPTYRDASVQAVFVGRLAPEKGVATLIEAWRALPDIPLTIAGEGPDEDVLRVRAPANVEFVGQLAAHEVTALLKKASVLIIPSIWYEGMPMVFLEALSQGVPVVASEIGSLRELVQPGVNGVLFSPGNPAELSAAVRQAISEQHAHLRRGARAIYERYYTPEQNRRMLEAAYDQAINLAKTVG